MQPSFVDWCLPKEYAPETRIQNTNENRLTSNTMKTTLQKSIVAFVAAVSTLILLGAGAGVQQQTWSITKTQVQTSALDTAEAAHLTFIREEEKMARDAYDAMYVKWGLTIFDQISDSEQEHMDAILSMLEKYGLPDPAQGPGVFTDPAIQGLYNWLMERGEVSALEALSVGAFIEEFDIGDLLEAIDETDNSDLDQVYGNLELGSENHLRSFVGLIENATGVDYTAQWLPQAQVNDILASSGSGKRTKNQGR